MKNGHEVVPIRHDDPAVLNKHSLLRMRDNRQSGTQFSQMGGFCVYNKSMNNSNIREFYPNLLQKGYTVSEIRETSKTVTREVPLAFRDRYNTYAEYESAIHDYMNGL